MLDVSCQLDGRFPKLYFEITILFFIKACSASPGWSLKLITSIAFYCFAVVIFFFSFSFFLPVFFIRLCCWFTQEDTGTSHEYLRDVRQTDGADCAGSR